MMNFEHISRCIQYDEATGSVQQHPTAEEISPAGVRRKATPTAETDLARRSARLQQINREAEEKQLLGIHRLFAEAGVDLIDF